MISETSLLDVPPYVRIFSASIVQDDPFRIRILAGCNPLDLKDTEIFGVTLAIMASANGQRTLAEHLADAQREDPAIPRDRIMNDLERLQADGLVRIKSTTDAWQADAPYSRHQLFYSSLPNVDSDDAQRRLQASSVSIIGVGGIGTWLSHVLAAAGVGELTLIDADSIERSNLTRQLFTEADVGRPKVEVAREHLLKLRPDLRVTTHQRTISSVEDLERCHLQPDLLLLAGDKPANICVVVNAYAVQHGIPWSRAGYHHGLATVGPLVVPQVTPCGACLEETGLPFARFTELPLISEINSRFTVPSFGPVNGLAATIQAKEAIFFLAGIEDHQITKGRIVTFDAMSLKSEAIDVQNHLSMHCTVCGRGEP